MRSLCEHTGRIFPVNRKNILGAILLLLIFYALAGAGIFESTKAGSRSLEAMPVVNRHLSEKENNTDREKTGHDSSSKTNSWRTIRMRVTGYCWCKKCCGKHSDGITANGHRIRIGDTFVAADKKFSFGTEMIVPGYNNSQPVKVLDRGRVIKGNRLDIFFNSHHRAKVWGVRYLPVKVKVK
jgi:3D (Asp-Asp-Asp) domain-containing protein